MKKPCEQTCDKCGSDDVLIQYIRKDEITDRVTVREVVIELDGLKECAGSHFRRRAIRDLLNCRCRRCQNVWTAKTLDQLKDEEREKTINTLIDEFGTKDRGPAEHR